LNRDEKEAVVAELATQLKDADAVFAVDYRGISVPQAAELRAKLREAEATFRVVKNRLTLRAVDQAGISELKEVLEGPTAFTFVKGDAVLAAKALAQFRREHEILEYKGGLMEGAVLDAEQFGVIARLPGLEVLHGQLAGMVASPLTGLVRGLGQLISGLAMQLKQIEEQGLVTGEVEEPVDEPDAAPAVEPPQQPPEEPEPEPAEEPEEEQETDNETSEEEKEE
jgi:large subunit ribosomal protein L10